jgi:CspA family cold shock protein
MAKMRGMAGHDATGIVDFFNDTGGYGFIETDAVEEDVFFHMEDVGGPDLVEGTEVAFDIEHVAKGPRAKNLIRLGKPDTTNKQPTSQADTATGTTNHRWDATGTVDFFNGTGGYGFVQTDAVFEDVFFHMEDVGGPDLVEGAEVAFNFEHRKKGPVATKIIRDPDDVITDTDSTAGSANNTEVYPSDTKQSSDTDTKIYTGDDTQPPETDTEVYTASNGDSSASTTATNSSAFCPNCSRDLNDHADPNFCPNCGTKL